ncbi:MAG: hypothetical protein K6G23_07205 [Lachnospiraceae bacterium]|nr:hypothetical protein [Lachnospiraceae bacterium]
MERHAFALQMNEGKLGNFLTALGEKWGEIRTIIDAEHVTNFSLWNAERFLFGYYESDKEEAVSGKLMAPLADVIAANGRWISDPEQNMAQMFEIYGVVREDKSMIRHRVFMTHLLTGDVKEYKRRHDEKRASMPAVPPGPDSNFTIWNAEDFIFGYDEIDTSMEHEETPEEHEDTVAWESNMLNIMEWITNDVDWLTGEHHAQVRRVAYYR